MNAYVVDIYVRLYMSIQVLLSEKRGQLGLEALLNLLHFLPNRLAVHGPGRRLQIRFTVSQVWILEHLRERFGLQESGNCAGVNAILLSFKGSP